MRTFISGASGFVGGHVCERMHELGHDVRGMARSDSSAEVVESYGGTPVRCSLTDVTAEHLEGCQAVVHTAAFVEEWGTREQFWSLNVEGTRRMLEAAKEAGVARFIHIGTEAALFDGRDLVHIDENYPYPERHRFLYSETKAEAEKLVLAANEEDFTTISLRPRFVWGPRDTSVLPAIQRMAALDNFAWIDAGQHMTSTCHVKNLVHAVELALSNGLGGRAYFIADDGERSMREFLTELLGTQGVELPGTSYPGFLVRPASAVLEATWRALGKESPPPVTRFAANMMSATVTVDTKRAREELGYEPVIDVQTGLRELAA